MTETQEPALSVATSQLEFSNLSSKNKFYRIPSAKLSDFLKSCDKVPPRQSFDEEKVQPGITAMEEPELPFASSRLVFFNPTTKNKIYCMPSSKSADISKFECAEVPLREFPDEENVTQGITAMKEPEVPFPSSLPSFLNPATKNKFYRMPSAKSADISKSECAEVPLREFPDEENVTPGITAMEEPEVLFPSSHPAFLNPASKNKLYRMPSAKSADISKSECAGVPLREFPDEENIAPDPVKTYWTDGDIKKLMKAYKAVQKIKTKKMLEKVFWNKVSDELMQEKVYKSGTQCNSKWKLLVNRYKDQLAQKGSTGEKRVTPWDHFDDMDEIMYNRPEINPPAVSSSIRGYEKRVYEQVKKKKDDKKKDKKQEEDRDTEDESDDEDDGRRYRRIRLKKRKRSNAKESKLDKVIEMSIQHYEETKKTRDEFMSMMKESMAIQRNMANQGKD